MKKLYSTLVVLFFGLLALPIISSAQTVGIGTDFPIASLDIRTNTDMSSINVERFLTPSTSVVAAVEVNDDSDWGALDIYYSNGTNVNGVAAYVENSSIGIGVWSVNSNAANANPVGLLTQLGVGDGLFVNMANGSGDGVFINMVAGVNGATVFNYSDIQTGLYVDNAGFDAWGILSIMEGGAGVYNFHLSPSPYSFYADLSAFGAQTSPYDNLGYTSYHDNSDGNGFYFTNTDGSSGGDGFGFIGFANTQTATVGTTVYGAILGAEQYGPGHGILINHAGVSGRNAEFNVIGNTNTDPAIFAIHEGRGSAILGQNQNNNIVGTVAVADFAYTGSDVDDHIGAYGYSAPVAGWGIGVLGAGGWYGVYSNGDLGASGVKSFVIDHPLDPESKILKHFTLESDKVLNVYQGTAVIGRSGKATISLPDYFSAINVDFSYQLTAIGTPNQPYVYKEIENNQFTIAGKPNSRASWMVIAHRNDAYLQAHPEKAIAEVDKKPSQQGKYLDPEAYGKPASMGIFYRDYSNTQVSSVPRPPQNTRVPAGRNLDKATFVSPKSAENEIAGREAKPERMKPTREDIDRMEIKQEIRTWDELK